MTGPSAVPPPESHPSAPPHHARAPVVTDMNRIGRRFQFATFVFVLAAIAAFGLAWALGYVHFD